jgi:hypothetical protein
VIRISVPARGRDYWRRVRKTVAKLLLLLAVLLMPVGMAAPAATVTQQHAASMPMDCPDHPAQHHSRATSECAMACASALAAAIQNADEEPLLLAAPVFSVDTRPLDGLHPEIATPPPRHS